MPSTLPTAAEHDLRTTSGIAFMIAGVFLVPMLDAFSKYLSDWLAPGQIALFRFGFQSVILMAILTARRELVWPGRDQRAGWRWRAGSRPGRSSA